MKINGEQTVKLKSGSVQFKNHFKRLAAPFKIYADFEFLFKRSKGSEKNNNSTSYTKKYQKHIPCSFAYKVVCIGDTFSNPVVIYKDKFTEAILTEINYCKKNNEKVF